jgi:hypothetical protein
MDFDSVNVQPLFRRGRKIAARSLQTIDETVNVGGQNKSELTEQGQVLAEVAGSSFGFFVFLAGAEANTG